MAPVSTWVIKNLRLDSLGIYGKTKYYWSKKRKKNALIKWIPITFCYAQISALLSHHQRAFLLQEMGTNTETHSQTLCREWEALEHLVLKGAIHHMPPLRAQRILWKRIQKKGKNQRKWRTPTKWGPLNQHEQISYKLTEIEAGYTGPEQVFIRSSVDILWLTILCFYETPECVNKWVSDSFTSSWALPFADLLVQVWYDSLFYLLFYFGICKKWMNVWMDEWMK